MNYWSPKRRKKGSGSERLFKEIMGENFSYLWRDLDIQVHEDYQSPKKLSLKISSPRHIIIKLSKRKRILKVAIEKKLVAFRRTPEKFISTFLNRNFAGREKVGCYIQRTKINKEELPTKNTLSSEIVLQKLRREIRSFQDKQKWRDFIIFRIALKEMLKGVLQDEMKGC